MIFLRALSSKSSSEFMLCATEAGIEDNEGTTVRKGWEDNNGRENKQLCKPTHRATILAAG